MATNNDEHRIVRNQILKKGGTTPEYVDETIPTDPIRLRFGPGRGTATKGVGSSWLMGTKTLPGSPNEFSYQMTKVRFNTSTPNVYFALVHSRDGTLDTPYFPSKSDDLTVGDLKSPFESLKSGTIKVYALGPGSSLSTGKGSTVRFQGIGSGGLFAIGFSADLYPV